MIKHALGLAWLENVNVLEIPQNVNITLQGNYCEMISICLYLLQLLTEKGKLTFQESSMQIVSVLFERAHLNKIWNLCENVLLCFTPVIVLATVNLLSWNSISGSIVLAQWKAEHSQLCWTLRGLL